MSRDGGVFAQDERHELYVWNSRTGRLIDRDKVDATPIDLHYLSPLMSPTGRQVLCTPAGRLLVYDVASRGPALDMKIDVPSNQWVPDFDWSPDGRLVALATMEGELQIYDLHRAQRIEKRKTGQGKIQFVRFSPDGRAILTRDQLSGLVWPAPEVKPFFEPLKEDEFPAAWEKLRLRSAAECREALYRLAASGPAAAKFLDRRLDIDRGLSRDKLDALFSRLQDDDFRKRTAAEKELSALEDAVIPELKKRLESGEIDADLAIRLKRLVDSAKKVALPHSAETLRHLRGIAVLESIRTEESRKALERLATGAEASPVTQEAKATLGRIQ